MESWLSFLRFYIRKKKTLSGSIKNKSCNSLEGQQLYKKGLQLRHKDLSMSRDQKVMTLLPPVEKCCMDFYQGVAFTAQIW